MSQPTPPPYPSAPAPMSPAEERNWALAAHLSSFVAAFFLIAFVGPLVVMLVAGPRSAFVRRQAVEALNFHLTWYLIMAANAALILVLIGLVTLPLAIGLYAILWVIFAILGAMAASDGRDFRYPLILRLVK